MLRENLSLRILSSVNNSGSTCSNRALKFILGMEGASQRNGAHTFEKPNLNFLNLGFLATRLSMSISSCTKKLSVSGFFCFIALIAERINCNESQTASLSASALRYCTKTRAATYKQKHMKGLACC